MLAYVPGFGTGVAVAQTGTAVAKTVVGEKTYDDVRSKALFTQGLQVGFIPLMPPMWPIQIGMFVFLIIVFLGLGFSGGKSVFIAYIGQALVAAIVWSWAADKIWSYGVGI